MPTSSKLNKTTALFCTLCLFGTIGCKSTKKQNKTAQKKTTPVKKKTSTRVLIHQKNSALFESKQPKWAPMIKVMPDGIEAQALPTTKAAEDIFVGPMRQQRERLYADFIKTAKVPAKLALKNSLFVSTNPETFKIEPLYTMLEDYKRTTDKASNFLTLKRQKMLQVWFHPDIPYATVAHTIHTASQAGWMVKLVAHNSSNALGLLKMRVPNPANVTPGCVFLTIITDGKDYQINIQREESITISDMAGKCPIQENSLEETVAKLGVLKTCGPINYAATDQTPIMALADTMDKTADLGVDEEGFGLAILKGGIKLKCPDKPEQIKSPIKAQAWVKAQPESVINPGNVPPFK